MSTVKTEDRSYIILTGVGKAIVWPAPGITEALASFKRQTGGEHEVIGVISADSVVTPNEAVSVEVSITKNPPTGPQEQGQTGK